jgi:hypothetical protein
MHATSHQPRVEHGRTSDPGDLAEALAIIVVMLSGAILVAVLIVTAFVT